MLGDAQLFQAPGVCIFPVQAPDMMLGTESEENLETIPATATSWVQSLDKP